MTLPELIQLYRERCQEARAQCENLKKQLEIFKSVVENTDTFAETLVLVAAEADPQAALAAYHAYEAAYLRGQDEYKGSLWHETQRILIRELVHYMKEVQF